MTNVRIVIPTFNRCSLLRLAVASALRQTYPSIEVVIYDNCSNDETQSYLAALTDPRVRIVRHSENIGMQANWIAALSEEHDGYTALLEDDNEFLPDHIAIAVRILETSGRLLYACQIHEILDSAPENVVSYGGLPIDESYTVWDPHVVTSLDPLSGNTFYSSGVVFHSSLARLVDWWGGSQLWCMDYYFWGSMFIHSGFVKSAAKSVLYRWHTGNSTYGFLDTWTNRLHSSIQYGSVCLFLVHLHGKIYGNALLYHTLSSSSFKGENLEILVKSLLWWNQDKKNKSLGRAILARQHYSRSSIIAWEIKLYIYSLIKELMTGLSVLQFSSFPGPLEDECVSRKIVTNHHNVAFMRLWKQK